VNKRSNLRVRKLPSQRHLLFHKTKEPQQPPVTNEDRRQEQNQGQRAETTPPAPTPNQKATQSGRQPIAGGENRCQELNQEQRAETTPPPPNTSPSQNRRAVQPSERQGQDRRSELLKEERLNLANGDVKKAKEHRAWTHLIVPCSDAAG